MFDTANANPDVPLYTLDLDSSNGLPFWIGRNNFSVGARLHQHQYVQINYITSGKGIHEVAGHRTPLLEGDIFVLPPYVPHRILPASNTQKIEVVEIEFLPEFLNEQFENLPEAKYLFDFSYIAPFIVFENNIKPRLNLTGVAKIKINEIVNTLHEEYHYQNRLFEHAFKAQLLYLLVELNRAIEKTDEGFESKIVFAKHRAAINTVLEYIDNHYTHELKIEDVSKIAMMSQSYFCFFFKTLVGKTFVQYLVEKRLEHAKLLLANTDMSVINVSINAGFNNVSHFIRTFKANILLSPTQYRRNCQTNAEPISSTDAKANTKKK